MGSFLVVLPCLSSAVFEGDPALTATEALAVFCNRLGGATFSGHAGFCGGGGGGGYSGGRGVNATDPCIVALGLAVAFAFAAKRALLSGVGMLFAGKNMSRQNSGGGNLVVGAALTAPAFADVLGC